MIKSNNFYHLYRYSQNRRSKCCNDRHYKTKAPKAPSAYTHPIKRENGLQEEYSSLCSHVLRIVDSGDVAVTCWSALQIMRKRCLHYYGNFVLGCACSISNYYAFADNVNCSNWKRFTAPVSFTFFEHHKRWPLKVMLIIKGIYVYKNSILRYAYFSWSVVW